MENANAIERHLIFIAAAHGVETPYSLYAIDSLTSTINNIFYFQIH